MIEEPVKCCEMTPAIKALKETYWLLCFTYFNKDFGRSILDNLHCEILVLLLV